MRYTLLIHGLAHIVLSGCGTMSASEQTPQAGRQQAGAVNDQSTVVQSLQRQVRERDRRIAELTFQLDALKTIEQEAQSRRLQGRFPGARDH